MSKLIPYDEDWIGFKYLEANRANINFKRDKEWLGLSHLEEILSLEDELLFDKCLTFEKKNVLLKANEGPNKPEPYSKHCKQRV